ncbi:MAG: hypothetical protein RLZ98_579 [Pseudomonadota bacterium]
MSDLDRRSALRLFTGILAAPLTASLPSRPAHAQAPQPAQPSFNFGDVATRAEALAKAPWENLEGKLPPVFETMDWDAWRNIRFRPDKALMRNKGHRYSLQLFHLGHLFKKPVTVNEIRDRVVSPVPYAKTLFDYGGLKLPKSLPVNMGFAGFRIHYPLNTPRVSDELISFVGSSYFRWLGRNQKYGLSARGLSINSGLLDNKEEFPFFREFWIDANEATPDRLVIYALLDSPSVAGAYQFTVYPGEKTPVDVNVRLFARQRITRLGMAPLTSMYFLGENDRHMNDRNKYDEFRPELHDSDGLLVHTANGEWIWRPLKNPLIQEVHQFQANNLKGFGLMQRDRRFESYHDIELNYEQRPSYWIEPKGDWGEGVVELIELATKDETADNIVCAFLPANPLEPGQSFSFAYRMHSLEAGLELHGLGHTAHTFMAPPVALGSSERASPLSRRLLVDFSGGELPYFLADPGQVEVVASAEGARVVRTFLVPNPSIKGFRAMIDVQYHSDTLGTTRAYLRSGSKLLSETWTYTWRFYNF